MWRPAYSRHARERVAALGAPLHTRAGLGTPELEVVGPFGPYEGFTAGGCVRRPGLDLALVETARAAGAGVRERIRDALRFGRLLGEAAAPCLDHPVTLDAALAGWEADRDAQCLPMYQWANLLGRDDDVSPVERAAYGWFAARPGGVTEVLDVFSRRRRPTAVFSATRAARWIVRAARDPEVSGPALRAVVRRDARRELDRAVEARLFARRRAASARG